MTTVKIPHEIADVIESWREQRIPDVAIVSMALVGGASPFHKLIHDWATGNNYDTLLSALVNGYEREQTIEQRRDADVLATYTMHYDTAFAHGIVYVLEKYGIKIGGVNAE